MVLLAQWPLQAWRDYRALTRYQPATCRVLSNRAVRSTRKSYLQGGPVTREVSIPEVTFTYVLPDGSHTVTGYDNYDGRTSDASVLVGFPADAVVPCWYDPGHPDRAVVARNLSWAYYASGIIPLFLTVIPGNFLFLALRRPSATPAGGAASRSSADLTPAQARAASLVLAIVVGGGIGAYWVHVVRQEGWLGPIEDPFLFFILLLGAGSVHIIRRSWTTSRGDRRRRGKDGRRSGRTPA
jgi:hypothetical protein